MTEDVFLGGEGFASPSVADVTDKLPDFVYPDRWTLLLVGRSSGLVGSSPESFPVGSPAHYERVEVVRREIADALYTALRAVSICHPRNPESVPLYVRDARAAMALYEQATK